MSAEQEELICKMALAHLNRGEDAISQRLKLLGIILSDRCVNLGLKRNGIPPALERIKTAAWDDFI